MSYLDRLAEMEYVSPSGGVFFLKYDEVERSGGKKAPVTESPDQDAATVQDLGEIVTTYPVTCYIDGPDYDIEADRFYKALSEKGPARLRSPRWGWQDVLPIARSQKESMVDGARAAVFTITFVQADPSDLRTAEKLTGRSVQADVEAAFEAVKNPLPEKLTEAAGTVARMKALSGQVLGEIKAAFDAISGITDDVRRQIEEKIAEITLSVDELVASPRRLVGALISLYQIPARLEVSVRSKISAYRQIYRNLASTLLATSRRYGAFFGMTSSAGVQILSVSAADAATAGEIPTRDEAAAVLSALSGFHTEIRASVEALETAGNFVSDYASLQAVEQAVTAAVRLIISRSLSLSSEQRMILDRELSPLQLSYELYGDLESLDKFMEINSFQGDEILMIPRGREVRWYV